MYHQTPLLDVCYHPKLTIIRGDTRNEKLIGEQLKTVDAVFPLAW